MKDPVHQAASKASANKIVFVLGEGFNKFAANALKKSLSNIDMKEGAHYEIMLGARNLERSGMVYLQGEALKMKTTGQPFVFQSVAEASVAVELLVKEGIIVVVSP